MKIFFIRAVLWKNKKWQTIKKYYCYQVVLPTFMCHMHHYDVLLLKKTAKQEEHCIYLSLIVNLLNEEKKSKRNLLRYCFA